MSDADWREYINCRQGAALTDSILLCCIYTAAWIPLWILPDSFGPLSAGAFFVQSGK